MTRSRLAIVISLVYSVPWLTWFAAQLRYIDWSPSTLHPFLSGSLRSLILLQVFSLALVFVNRPRPEIRDSLQAICFIMLYPLPFFAIFWLAGGASPGTFIHGFALVGAAAGAALLIQLCERLLRDDARLPQTLVSAIHLLPAIVIWNFRDLWQNLLNR